MMIARGSKLMVPNEKRRTISRFRELPPEIGIHTDGNYDDTTRINT